MHADSCLVTFAYWVLIFAVLAFLEPGWFVGLKSYIVPLLVIGVVMIGKGIGSF